MNGETREERLKRILQAKQRLATQRNFWIVNAYTEPVRAYYRVVKQVDEAIHRNRDIMFIISSEMEEFTEKLLDLNELAKRICQKLKEKYIEPRFIEKLKRIKGDGAGNEENNN